MIGKTAQKECYRAAAQLGLERPNDVECEVFFPSLGFDVSVLTAINLRTPLIDFHRVAMAAFPTCLILAVLLSFQTRVSYVVVKRSIDDLT